jgi:hypothetical protein
MRLPCSVTDSFSVTSGTNDPNLSNNNASVTAVVTEPAITVSAPITTTSRTLSNVTVATFTHANGVEPASAFSATINWGDSTSSTGTITQSGTTYTVKGSHKYSFGRSHTITTTVNEVGQAAELLLLKVGDEVPDLPASIGYFHDHGQFSLNDQTNKFAQDVDAYFGKFANLSGSSSSGSNNNAGITLQNLNDSLIALLSRGKTEARQPPLKTLLSNLHARNTSDLQVLSILLLIEDTSATF